MTSTTSLNIVEHVARAICDNDHGPGSSSAWNLHFGEYRGSARAAILATLQYLRDHPSEKMIEASRNTGVPDFYLPTDDSDKFRAMISAALEDIEERAG